VPRLSTEPIELNELERKELEHLLKRASTPQQIALRVKIVILADKQESHRKIAQELGITKKMSRLWRQRWRELTARQVPMVERLLDIPRPGSPGRFMMEQITQWVSRSVACEPPEKDNRPLSHWTVRELAAEMIQQVMDCLNTLQSEAYTRLVAKLGSDSLDLGEKGKSGILKSMLSRAEFFSAPYHRLVIHFTPKHCSWLNQIEIWFSILMRKLLRRGNFISNNDLKERIIDFIDYFNLMMAKPFK
jgi:transposase